MRPPDGRIIAVCVSGKKGEKKVPVPFVTLVPEYGVAGCPRGAVAPAGEPAGG
jgi:hypothetical protein